MGASVGCSEGRRASKHQLAVLEGILLIRARMERRLEDDNKNKPFWRKTDGGTGGRRLAPVEEWTEKLERRSSGTDEEETEPFWHFQVGGPERITASDVFECSWESPAALTVRAVQTRTRRGPAPLGAAAHSGSPQGAGPRLGVVRGTRCWAGLLPPLLRLPQPLHRKQTVRCSGTPRKSENQEMMTAMRRMYSSHSSQQASA